MDGQPVPYQTECTGENAYDLLVLSDLPTDGLHEFDWRKGTECFDTLAKLPLDNGILQVTSIKNGLVEVRHRNGACFRFTLSGPAPLRSEESVSGGSVEARLEKTLYFPNGAVYHFCIKLKRELDYAEIYEEMQGWEGQAARVRMQWEKFSPRYRNTLDRGEEKIDAYLREDGNFPFVLNPYMPARSWWDQKHVAFLDKKSGFWAGLLLHDIEHFHDGNYEIWGSRDTLAIALHPHGTSAPLQDGMRAYMLILCDDKPVEAIMEHYRKYYSHACLDCVKDWVLSWEDDRDEYPKYYRIERDTVFSYWYNTCVGKPSPEDMMEVLDRENTIFAHLERVSPVSCRSFRAAWAPLFDLTANQMSPEQFDRVRAAMAFTCYVLMGEKLLPYAYDAGRASQLFNGRHISHRAICRTAWETSSYVSAVACLL